MTSQRTSLLDILGVTLANVEGAHLVREALPSLSLPKQLHLVAIGKAAVSMANGAYEALGDRIAAGLVITKHGHGAGAPCECVESGHPQPDGHSLEAGRRLLAFIATAPRDSGWLFLISGGASALVEVLPEGMDLETLREANAWLLGSGLPIGQMNRVRKGLSLIKGGRLARYLAGREVWNLLLSDVPGDDPATIGSGLLVAGSEQNSAPDLAGLALPEGLRAALGRVPPAPSPGEACFARITTHILANNQTALAAAAARGAALGLTVVSHGQALDGPVQGAAEHILEALAAAPGLHIFGGETTVELPPHPGRGGRNQHLALLLARDIAASGIEVLCVGTDGSDGDGTDAGALVDGGTRERGDLHYPGGIDAAIAAFDAGRYLEASGDLLSTGPTGTNVMDMVLAYRPG